MLEITAEPPGKSKLTYVPDSINNLCDFIQLLKQSSSIAGGERVVMAGTPFCYSPYQREHSNFSERDVAKSNLVNFEEIERKFIDIH